VSVHAGIVVGDSPCIITEDVLHKRLYAEPTVRVRRCDIVSRWRESCDLRVLIFERDEDWHEINVLGNSIAFDYSVLYYDLKQYATIVLHSHNVLIAIFPPLNLDWWNSLPAALRSTDVSVETFRTQL